MLLSDKQNSVFQRRIVVYDMKFIQNYQGSSIANILNVNKSTISRDIDYLKAMKKVLFLDRLEEYNNQFKTYIQSDKFKRTATYDIQKKQSEWLKISDRVIEILNEELKVAESDNLLW